MRQQRARSGIGYRVSGIGNTGPETRNPKPETRPAFTLIELMISIAMVLLLMAGINAVFSATQKTTSTGMALSAIGRDQRAMERVFTRDFGHAVSMSEMPWLIITSRQTFAFRNRDDEVGNVGPGGMPLGPMYYDSNGNGNPVPTSAAVYNAHNHRVDSIGFFARDNQTPFYRQTANQPTGGTYSAPLYTPETSREAYIWYGHLNVPTNTTLDPNPLSAYTTQGQYFEPGQPNQPPLKINTNNYYFNDWCFGRVAMLLHPQTANTINDFVPVPPMGVTPPPVPLARGTQAVHLAGTTTTPAYIPPAMMNGKQVPWQIEQGRFDVANASIAYLRNYMSNASFAPTSAAGVTPYLTDSLDYRFNCKPWAVRWDPAAMGGAGAARDMSLEAALSTPLLMKGVSHFVVEYAGDFIGQQPDGRPLPMVAGVLPPRQPRNRPDGQIDFIVLPNGSRQIRWYGMPRYVPLPGAITPPSIPGMAFSTSPCVVPLRVVNSYAADGTTEPNMAQAPCEEFVFMDPQTRTVSGNVPTANVQDYADPNMYQGQAPPVYRAIFTPQRLAWPALYGRPSLIRLVVTFADPNGRLPEGYTAEYVFALTY